MTKVLLLAKADTAFRRLSTQCNDIEVIQEVMTEAISYKLVEGSFDVLVIASGDIGDHTVNFIKSIRTDMDRNLQIPIIIVDEANTLSLLNKMALYEAGVNYVCANTVEDLTLLYSFIVSLGKLVGLLKNSSRMK